jgi:SOS-response transcriptional repressor LexA
LKESKITTNKEQFFPKLELLLPHAAACPPSGDVVLLKMMKSTKDVPIDSAMQPEDAAREALPLYLLPVAAGFPSPSEDYLDRKLDLHSHLMENHAATFFLRAGFGR